MAGDRFEVISAGTQEEIHPLAVKAMEEIGIDISNQQPKGVKEYLGTKSRRSLDEWHKTST